MKSLSARSRGEVECLRQITSRSEKHISASATAFCAGVYCLLLGVLHRAVCDGLAVHCNGLLHVIVHYNIPVRCPRLRLAVSCFLDLGLHLVDNLEGVL